MVVHYALHGFLSFYPWVLTWKALNTMNLVYEYCFLINRINWIRFMSIYITHSSVVKNICSLRWKWNYDRSLNVQTTKSDTSFSVQSYHKLLNWRPNGNGWWFIIQKPIFTECLSLENYLGYSLIFIVDHFLSISNIHITFIIYAMCLMRDVCSYFHSNSIRFRSI